MSHTPSIQIHNLSYTPMGCESPLFQNINLTIANEKVSLVGHNGVGKSSLFKLIAGLVLPSQGNISTNAKIAYLSQQAPTDSNMSVAHVLGINEKLAAFYRISQGSTDANDYSVLGDDWTIEDRAKLLLDRFGMSYLSLAQSVADLSGGEHTRLNLSRVFISDADFILLDEPTNNLDKNSRDILYQEIAAFKGGVLSASHDRALLQKMDRIIELTTLGVTSYGGNYDFYKDQKAIKQQAIEQEIQSRAVNLIKSKQAIQTRIERHQKNEALGRKARTAQIKAKGSYDKISLKAKKGRSECTNRRIRQQAGRKLDTVNAELSCPSGKPAS